MPTTLRARPILVSRRGVRNARAGWPGAVAYKERMEDVEKEHGVRTQQHRGLRKGRRCTGPQAVSDNQQWKRNAELGDCV